jgi:hypothetical protein
LAPFSSHTSFFNSSQEEYGDLSTLEVRVKSIVQHAMRRSTNGQVPAEASASASQGQGQQQHLVPGLNDSGSVAMAPVAVPLAGPQLIPPGQLPGGTLLGTRAHIDAAAQSAYLMANGAPVLMRGSQAPTIGYQGKLRRWSWPPFPSVFFASLLLPFRGTALSIPGSFFNFLFCCLTIWFNDLLSILLVVQACCPCSLSPRQCPWLMQQF